MRKCVPKIRERRPDSKPSKLLACLHWYSIKKLCTKLVVSRSSFSLAGINLLRILELLELKLGTLVYHVHGYNRSPQIFFV